MARTSTARIDGTNGNDDLYGGVSGEQINGRGGNDHIYAGGGNDTVSGGAGSDYIMGGVGSDVLSGGSGPDTFVYVDQGEGGDTITDFETGVEHIQLFGASRASPQVFYGGSGKAEGIMLSYGYTESGVDFWTDTIFLQGVTSLSPGDIAFIY